MRPEIQNGWQYNIRKLFGLIDQNVGAKNGTNVSVRELSGALKKTVLTFTNQSVTMTDAAANGSQGSLKIYDFPAGNIILLGASSNLTIARVGTALTTTAAVVGSIGTVAAANSDATLTSTEADIIPSTTATLSSGAGAFRGESVTATIAAFDGTTTAKDAYLNFAVPDAGSTGNDALTVNGTVTIVWADAGDN